MRTHESNYEAEYLKLRETRIAELRETRIAEYRENEDCDECREALEHILSDPMCCGECAAPSPCHHEHYED